MQMRSIIISVVVGIAILKFCSKAPPQKPLDLPQTQPTQSSADTAAQPTPQSSPQPQAMPNSTDTAAQPTTTQSNPQPQYTPRPIAPLPALAPTGDKTIDAQRKTDQNFNAQLDAATAEAAVNPADARSSALTARRAAKLKSVRAAQSAAGNQ